MWSLPIAECHPKQITGSILQFKVSLLSAKLKVVQSLQCPSARLPRTGGKKRISKSSNILASQYSSSLQLLEVWLDTWRNTMQKSGVPTAKSGRGPKLRLRLSRRRRWRVVRWRTPRSGSMMWGQARGVFLFLQRYVLERDISCVNSFSVQMLPDVPESPVYWAERIIWLSVCGSGSRSMKSPNWFKPSEIFLLSNLDP